MADETSLVPIDTRSVDFYGDTILGALVRIEGVGEPQIYVPLRPICEYLGLSWASQFNRIKRDEVLDESLRGVFITKTPQEGGTQEMLCLPLEMLPGWLFGISATRVRADLKDKILQYRRECYRVLWDAFKHDIFPTTELDTTTRAATSGAELAYEIATAVQHLARQQLDFEQRLGKVRDWARGIATRVSTLEVQIGPYAPVSDAQAADLAQAVRNVGYQLEQRGIGDYRSVYTELYKTFGITGYKNLPREKYEAALTWLHAWFTELTRQDPSLPPPSSET